MENEDQESKRLTRLRAKMEKVIMARVEMMRELLDGDVIEEMMFDETEEDERVTRTRIRMVVITERNEEVVVEAVLQETKKGIREFEKEKRNRKYFE